MRQANSRNVRHSTRQRNEVTCCQNGSVTRATVGMFRRASWMPSRTVPEVQLPQWPYAAMTAEHVSEISARSSVEARALCVSLFHNFTVMPGDPLNRFTDELKKLNRPWEAVGEQPDLLARREVSRQFIWNSWSERSPVDHETSCHDLRVRRRTRRHRSFTQLRA